MNLRGFNLDHDGYLSVNLFNPFGFNDETIRIGDEDHTEVVAIPQLISISKDSVIL